MKNKILSSLFIIITLFTFFCVKVEADTITIYAAWGDGYVDIDCSNTFANCTLKTVHKITNTKNNNSSKEEVFCADHDVQTPGGGNYTYSWTCSAPKTDSALAKNNIQVGYVIKNKSTGELKNYGNYLITQFAVWHYIDAETANNYFDFTNKKYKKGGGSNTQTNTKTLMDLVDEADSFVTSAKDPLKVTIETVNKNYKLTKTSDGNYFISDPITISVESNDKFITNPKVNSIKVEGPTGIFITYNEKATTGNTTLKLDAAAKNFYIKIPVASLKSITSIDATIKAELGYTVPGADYCTNSDGFQPLVIYSPKNKTTTATKKFTANRYDVSISKVDITGSKEIPGAKLTVKDSNGKTVDTWDSTNEAHKISLFPGKYVLEEIVAPDGYILSESKLSFEVTSKGTVKVGDQTVDKNVIKFVNEPIIVKILKTDLTGENEVEGAHLKITDKDGNIQYDVLGNKLEWVSTKEQVSFSLKAGKYVLTETVAPEGYELSENSIEFEVTVKNKVLINNEEVKDNLIVFKNEPTPEQVPTGSTYIYIAVAGLCSLGLFIYLFNKKKGLFKFNIKKD